MHCCCSDSYVATMSLGLLALRCLRRLAIYVARSYFIHPSPDPTPRLNRIKTTTYGVRPSTWSRMESWIFSQVLNADRSWCFVPCLTGSIEAANIMICLLSASRSSFRFPSQSSARSGGSILLTKVALSWMKRGNLEQLPSFRSFRGPSAEC